MKTEFAMVYDSGRGLIIAYGGRDKDSESVNETWAYDYTTNSWFKSPRAYFFSFASTPAPVLPGS